MTAKTRAKAHIRVAQRCQQPRLLQPLVQRDMAFKRSRHLQCFMVCQTMVHCCKKSAGQGVAGHMLFFISASMPPSSAGWTECCHTCCQQAPLALQQAPLSLASLRLRSKGLLNEREALAAASVFRSAAAPSSSLHATSISRHRARYTLHRVHMARGRPFQARAAGLPPGIRYGSTAEQHTNIGSARGGPAIQTAQANCAVCMQGTSALCTTHCSAIGRQP